MLPKISTEKMISKPMVQRRSQTFFQQILLGTLASTIFQLSIPVTSLSQPNGVLGVLRSQEQLDQWNPIEQRLQTSRISYRTIDLETLKSASELQGIGIIFLPNIELIKTEQVKILQEWVQQGGQLIASGPVGQRSSPLARQLLRSLLGSYWAFPLNTPARPQVPKNRCRAKDPACSVLTSWGPSGLQSSPVQGGVLIPTTLQSYTAGIWEASGSSPAVVTTEKATYFGWQWGSAQSAAVDTAWLQAAVNRHGLGAATAPVAVTPPAPSPQRTPSPQATLTPPTVPNVPRTTVQPMRPVTPPTVPTVPSPPPTPAATVPRVAPPPPTQTATRTIPNTSPIPNTFIDPSDQAAPAGLEVQPGNEPIGELTAIAMRQELTDLLGRFESALIASHSGGVPINLQVASTQLTASTGLASQNFKQADEIISKARQVIKDFPQLVAQQNWGEARRQWLEIRQKLWQNYPQEGERLGAEIRAVWLDRGTIVKARSEAGLAQIFDRLAAAGINTVYFETINAGYPIYPSQVAPQQNPLTVGWNPLEAAVKLAHERGMELHAWMWTFAVGNDRHNEILGQPSSFLSPVIEAHPDWVNINNYGQLRNPRDRKVYLDPANREARAYLLRIINEIVSNYKVDGLQLDYIRYPFQDPGGNYTYGYGKAGREQFRQLTGVDPINLTPKSGALWTQWTQFRADQVTSFVAEVSQFLRQKAPKTILSVAVFPHPEQERVLKIQQHWEVWAKQGYVDLIVPMTYAMDTNRLQRISQPLTSQQRLGSALITPSVKLLNLPDIVAIDQLQALRDLPTGGYAIFAMESLNNNIQNYFRRTQSHSQEKPVIPYRKPFAAALDRYLALKREWSFLLANDQLWVRDDELQLLSKEAEKLAEVLKQLDENPSAQNIGTAKQQLAQFQKQFQMSMRLQALEHPYQVSSWGNRLASIEMLLRYGERVQYRN